MILESPFLRLSVDPTEGGRIEQISSARDSWLFFDRSLGVPRDAPFEARWLGGFDELFPSDPPETVQGRSLPDHGELWNAPFTVLREDRRRVELVRDCSTVPALFYKAIELAETSPSLTLQYRLVHQGPAAFPYQLKLHPALRVEPGDQLIVPRARVELVDEDFSRLAATGGVWPVVPATGGGEVDLGRVPPRGPDLREFVYLSGLGQGRCGIRRAATGETLLFSYSLEEFPYICLFMAYGGWNRRGREISPYHTVVMEPCTTIPKDLGAAMRAGTGRTLHPGETADYRVSLSIVESC